jgi:hypothetical protein
MPSRQQLSIVFTRAALRRLRAGGPGAARPLRLRCRPAAASGSAGRRARADALPSIAIYVVDGPSAGRGRPGEPPRRTEVG